MGSQPKAPGPTFVPEPEDVRRRTNVLTQGEARRRASGGRASTIQGSAPILSPDDTPQGAPIPATDEVGATEASLTGRSFFNTPFTDIDVDFKGADEESVEEFRKNVREGSKETFAHFIGQDVRERERKRTAALGRRRSAATRTTTLLGSARA